MPNQAANEVSAAFWRTCGACPPERHSSAAFGGQGVADSGEPEWPPNVRSSGLFGSIIYDVPFSGSEMQSLMHIPSSIRRRNASILLKLLPAAPRGDSVRCRALAHQLRILNGFSTR